MIFGVDERKQFAKKIYDRYLKEGAEYEVTVTAEMRKKIKEEVRAVLARCVPGDLGSLRCCPQMDDPPEELFEDAQGGVYQVQCRRFPSPCQNPTRIVAPHTELSTSDTQIALPLFARAAHALRALPAVLRRVPRA